MRTLRELICSSVHLAEPLVLPVLVVNEDLNLSGCQIGHIDFRNVVFKGRFVAQDAHFAGVCWFDNAMFEQGLDACGTTFDWDARFDGATFAHFAKFDRAEFHGIACFNKATINGDFFLARALVFGNLSMEYARVAGRLDLSRSECLGGIWAEMAEFRLGRNQHLARANGRVSFRSALS